MLVKRIDWHHVWDGIKKQFFSVVDNGTFTKV